MTSETIEILGGILAIVGTLYLIIKSIKSCQTPCFRIEVNDEPIDVNVFDYVKHSARNLSGRSEPKNNVDIENVSV